MEKKIKGILFDLGWTLEYPASGDWTITNRFYDFVGKEAFLSIEKEKRQAAMAHAHAPLSAHHYTRTLEEENEKFIGYYTTLNSDLNLGLSGEAIAEIARDHTWNFDNYIQFPDTLSTLKTLKEQGYRIGVLSDTWPSTVPQQKLVGNTPFYDCMTLSFELGVMKPDPKMYEDAIAKMGLAPQDIVYVDDLTMSLDAAGAYGIHGVRSIAEHPDVRDDRYPCIKSPGGILNLLPDGFR